MFEYMASGLPVISSNFELWKQIVISNQCGICVNPQNPKEIAAAIDHLADNPQQVREMGLRGRDAVLEQYNWKHAEANLLRVYEEVLS